MYVCITITCCIVVQLVSSHSCPCVAGKSGSCTHVCQLLWIIYGLNRKNRTRIPNVPTITSLECYWTKKSILARGLRSKERMNMIKEISKTPIDSIVVEKHDVYADYDKEKKNWIVDDAKEYKNYLLELILKQPLVHIPYLV